jgi:ubiquinone/menaquinone biosynthesis C-methylase UbiE
LSSEILGSSPSRILYFAPISGLEHNIRKLNQTSVTTTDLNQTVVDVRADITNLPFQNCAFDLIICSHVLEHIRDDCVALEEIYRVVNKKGKVFILIPQDRQLEFTYEDSSVSSRQQRLKSYGSPDHMRLYGRDAANQFNSVGFKVNTIDYNQNLEDEFVRTHSMQEHENWLYSTSCIFECSK